MTEEKVIVMSEGDVLVTDGDARLSLVPDVGIDNMFGLVAADGGGFTGVLLTDLDWQLMKEKVDDFLRKRENAQPVADSRVFFHCGIEFVANKYVAVCPRCSVKIEPLNELRNEEGEYN